MKKTLFFLLLASCYLNASSQTSYQLEKTQEIIDKALKLQKNGFSEEALTMLDLATESGTYEKTICYLYYVKAQIYGENNDFDKAISSYSMAIQKNKAYKDAYYNLGTIYYNRGVELNQKAKTISNQEEYTKAMDNANEHFENAIQYFETVYILNPNDASVLDPLKVIYNQLMNKKTIYKTCYTEIKKKINGEYNNYTPSINYKPKTFIDNRDGINYKYVKIGSQYWMAENLRYRTNSGNYHYNNEYSTLAKYGRLYTWETAKNACPDGWHLPSKDEFEILNDYVNSNPTALLEGGSSGFSALLGGKSALMSDGSISYLFLNDHAFFWTSSNCNGIDGFRFFVDNKSCYLYCENKTRGLSVRCIKN